jgi:hypothetical protein
MLRLGKRKQGSRQKRVSADNRGWRFASLIFAGLLLAGCSVNGVTNASLSPRGGTTVAFESIDGLPRGQFQKLVKALTEEADARQIAVVTRESSATFRARGYASAQMRGKQTMIAWVWDIYDADKQRAVRISGEEKATSTQRGWPAADDATLKRIARDSIDQLAAFLANPGQPAPTPQTPSDGVVIANGTDAAIDAARPMSKPSLDRTVDAGWRQQTAIRTSVAAYSGVSSR